MLQDMSFAIGHRLLTMIPRQAEIARRGIAGGGFAPSEEKRRKPGEPVFFLPDHGDRWQPPIGWNIWASGFGGHRLRDADPAIGSTHQTLTFATVVAGVDYRVSTNLLVGLAMGFGTGGYAMEGYASTGDARSALFGFYGSWSAGTLYVDAALSYAYTDHMTTRIVAAVAPERVTGNLSGHQFGTRFEAGWRTVEFPVSITPFGALTIQRLRQAGYTETSRIITTGAPGSLGLTIADATAWSARSELGVQLQLTSFVEAFALLNPRVRIAWAHEFSTDRRVTTASTVPGARPAANALLVSAGVQFWLGGGINGYAQFDGEWAANGRTYAGGAGLRKSW